jgi:opacity protein-like surface antigen
MTTFGLAVGQAAAQPKVCIPAAVGVPGNPGPPDWYTAGQPQNGRPYRPYDPRWLGAVSLDYGSGSVSQASFRGLADGASALLFSWNVKTSPDILVDSTSFFVGIAPKTANAVTDKANARILRFRLKQASTVAANEWLPKPRQDGATLYFDVTEFTFNGTDWVAGPASAWIDTTARVWIRNTNDTVNVPDIAGTVAAPLKNEWVVQLRVPITASPATGVNVSLASFRMWHYAQLAGNFNPNNPPATIPYTWPTTTVAQPGQYVYQIISGKHTFPEPNIWGEFSTGTQGCGGITMTWSDIGTGNATSQSYIDVLGSNNFFANPANNNTTAVSANVLKASIRFANWGSQVGVVTPASWVGPPQLAALADTGGISAAAMLNDLNPPHGSMTAAWTPDQTWKCKFIGKNGVPANQTRNNVAIPGDPTCPNAAPELMLHQCMLVTLTGPGLVFLNDSAFRNMDFVNASTFQREADISVAGLAGMPGGKRDVYLFVEQLNMLQFTDQSTSKGRGVRQPTPPGVAAPPPASGFTQVPALIVHAYHDTGIDLGTETGTSRLLIPQNSYGYLVSHNGDLEGWTVKTLGAQPIAGSKTHFKIPVPNDGAARITNVIEAVDPKRFGIGVHIGVDIPHGELADSVDSALTAGLDFEVRLAPRFAAVATVMWTSFEDASGSDLKLTRVSGSVKGYLANGRFRPFLLAGTGAYVFDPGQSQAGVNLGGGIQGLVTHVVAVEATYQYHAVSGSSPKAKYSEVTGGVRFRF